MSLKFFSEYVLINFLLMLSNFFSEKNVFKFFRFTGLISYYFFKKRRQLAIKNINIAFPNKNKKEKIIIIKKSFQNLSEIVAYNLLIFSNRINEKNINKYVTSKTFNNLESCIAKSSSGVLILTGHIGNWECMSHFISLNTSSSFYAIARHMNNPLIENKFVSPIRKKFGINVFPKKNAILKLRRVLKKGSLAGILIDQKLNDKMHIKTNFFNKTAKSTPLPAILQIRCDVPIIFGYMIKNSSNKYELFFDNEIKIDYRNIPNDDLISYITSIYQKKLENVIKNYPEQWLWAHDRWGIKE